MQKQPSNPPVEAERARRASEADTGGAVRRPLRMSAKRKTEIVLRLLRGEDMETLSRELQVPAARISGWKDCFLEGGAAAFKKRSAKEEKEIRGLREKLGASTMENELLHKKIEKLENGRPFRLVRSKR